MQLEVYIKLFIDYWIFQYALYKSY